MEEPKALCTLTSCDKQPIYTCSRCRCARYCSKTCQETHYLQHKNVCISTAKMLAGKNLKDSFFTINFLLTDQMYKYMVDGLARGLRFPIDTEEGTILPIKRVDSRYS